MRLRRNWTGEERLPSLPGVLSTDPSEVYGHMEEIFGRKAPIYLEIGMGKGDFIRENAILHPENNYIGLEVSLTVAYIAAHKNEEEPLPNLRFLTIDANLLPQFFKPGEVDRIFLNFSDPWPKKRHARRRLTYRGMLELYKKILKPGGEIHFKTDGLPLFEFSIEEFIASGFSLGKITYDLHHSGFEGNVLTEYERRFLKQGVPINRLEAYYD